MASVLSLRGVRVHNLKSIDVDIPLHRITVVTGVSGAGKRSLVFDTLYAEAQRRYLQSFSVYTRQFLERHDKPDAEQIGDLPPSIAICPSASSASPRVTVGSLTELDASLRLLFARAGTIVCPQCRMPIHAHRVNDVITSLQAMPAGTRAAIAFRSSPAEIGPQAAWQAGLREEGFLRVQVNGVAYHLSDDDVPPVKPADSVWVILDRIEIGKTDDARLAESVEAAWQRGGGRVGVLTASDERTFDRQHRCAECQRVFPGPEPRLFDPDDPLGACPTCRGTGLQPKSHEVCPSCLGRRFNPDALAVLVDGQSIAQWRALPLGELRNIVTKLVPAGGSMRAPDLLVKQMNARLDVLIDLQLAELTLDQALVALDYGTSQRIALACAMASNLVNVLYLISEPTIGVHPRDIGKVGAILQQLRNCGNTVVVVEHERAIIAIADQVIDLGPEAGEEGGQVTYQGPVEGLAHAAEHPTSDFWTVRSCVEVPERRRKPAGWLKLVGASADSEIAFPLGVLCIVTGASGANKRALVEHSLHAAWTQGKSATRTASGERPGDWRILGGNRVSDIVLLDQAGLARAARSNPATYVKIFDEIRELFAQTTDAKIRNYGPGHFSFNQPGGRCETCQGEGALTIDMQFLADVRTICPDCHGKRYRKEILAVKVRSLSIAQVLEMTVREAFRFFRAQPAIERKLKMLLDVGLEYLQLGQPIDTLSGSEAQRLKLAGRLASSRKTGCVFLLIEPSAGLHPADIVELVACFDRLLSAGHSMIAIEHDLDLIKSADWIIDLGQTGSMEAQGTPEQVAAAGSFTGKVLAEALAMNRSSTE